MHGQIGGHSDGRACTSYPAAFSTNKAQRRRCQLQMRPEPRRAASLSAKEGNSLSRSVSSFWLSSPPWKLAPGRSSCFILGQSGLGAHRIALQVRSITFRAPRIGTKSCTLYQHVRSGSRLIIAGSKQVAGGRPTECNLYPRKPLLVCECGLVFARLGRKGTRSMPIHRTLKEQHMLCRGGLRTTFIAT